MNSAIRRMLFSNGFTEVIPWQYYSHSNGLVFSCDDHEWEIENEREEWLEKGSLNDLSAVYSIINDYNKERKQT